MTLDEEIFLFKTTADETELALKRKDEMNDDFVRHLEKKAKRCRQIEEWLKELKRARILLEATHNLFEKQMESGYVLNLLSETVFYDGGECDGECLMEDIENLLEYHE